MRYTIYCMSMDEMIDLAAAFAEGGLSGLRDAIRQNDTKGQQMPEEQKEYDNSNRIALWAREDNAKGVYTGYGEFDGEKVYSSVLVTNEKRKGDKSPIADFYWRTENATYACPIFSNDGKLGGRIDGWWINAFKNETGPPVVIKFKQMEAAPVGASASSVESDDIPL